MDFQIWNENYDVSGKMKCEMMKNVLCLHYSDNISCNNSSASQHWVLLTCSQPIKTRVTTPSYNNAYCAHENNTRVGKIALAPDIQHEHSILTASAEGASALFLKKATKT